VHGPGLIAESNRFLCRFRRRAVFHARPLPRLGILSSRPGSPRTNPFILRVVLREVAPESPFCCVGELMQSRVLCYRGPSWSPLRLQSRRHTSRRLVGRSSNGDFRHVVTGPAGRVLPGRSAGFRSMTPSLAPTCCRGSTARTLTLPLAYPVYYAGLHCFGLVDAEPARHV